MRWFLILVVISSCSPVNRAALYRSFRHMENRFHHHAGFVLYDPEKQKTMYTYKGDRYFTPASNIKVFTLFTALQVLGDSIPAYQYQIRSDSLLFRGTGDPTCLYEGTFSNDRPLDFLKNFPGDLYLVEDHFFADPLGPGWAWSDYPFSYSPERSSFPLYGNLFTMERTADGKTSVTPSYFKKYFRLADSAAHTTLLRDFASNRIEYSPAYAVGESEKRYVPFKPTLLTVAELLEDTLKRPVHILPRTPVNWERSEVIYSVPADSLYKTMMQESDNLISEQLLMMCSWVLTDSLKPEAAIRFMMQRHLADLPDKPQWFDGSGLSRYNLVTPRTMVSLWEKISRSLTYNRLFAILPSGGRSGTLRHAYAADVPYVYGKTGTLRNNHCLSGFLITRKQRILLFSFMNSNFTAPVQDIRKEMEKILRTLHEKL
jgi:D-alanyl-D-alanine carboxypeptidase/D-alanyl-D-alanine-endopeptidase (penicillin-binding protein 4)